MKYQGSCIRLLLTASASAAFSKQNRWVCFLPSFFFFSRGGSKSSNDADDLIFFCFVFSIMLFSGKCFPSIQSSNKWHWEDFNDLMSHGKWTFRNPRSSLYSFQNSRLHKHTLISEKPGKNICSRLKIWQEKKFHFSISISFFLFKKAVRCLLSEACLHQQMWTLQSVEAYLYTTVTDKSQKNTLTVFVHQAPPEQLRCI